MKTTILRVSVALFVLSGLLMSGPAARADDPPAGSGVSIRKVTVYSGLTQSAKYIVTGGSPRLQALVRRLEWAENELGVVEQLQLLKLDTVASERRAAALRNYQPNYPSYFPTDVPGFGESTLQKNLQRQLAYEATPEAAQQLIGFLEQVQTDLNAELKALPPAEKKAAEGPVEALQQRVAALPQSAVPPMPPQPVVFPNAPAVFPSTPAVRPSVPAVLPNVPVSAPVALGPMGPIGLPVTAAGANVEVQWGGTWYPAQVLAVNGGSTRIHYTNYDSSWDEWVPPARIRPAGTLLAATYPYGR
jgi:hypothetical protein